MRLIFSPSRNKLKTIILVICLLGLYYLTVTPDDFAGPPRDMYDIAVHPVFDPPLQTNTNVKENTVETNAITESKYNPICPKKSHIYYVKIHKTGSSTFQNILYRIGLRNNLSFALFGCAYGMTYPHPPKKEFLYQNPTFQEFRGYDLLTDHSQYHPDIFKEYMPTDTKVITLLRHPLHQLKSTFGFWGLPAKFGILEADAVQEYINNPTKYEQKRNSFGCPPTIQISQTKNPQSHHLGLLNDSPNPEEISSLRTQIDEQFSLVMILERFEESLLMFKRMFCLSFKDIIHLNLFSTKFFNRKTYDYNSTREDDIINKHRLWSDADYNIYDYFSNKLDREIEALGNDLQEELIQFREIKDSVRLFCNASCEIFNDLKTRPIEEVRLLLNSQTLTIASSKWSPSFQVSRGDCALMMFETLIYDESIKARQWPTRCPGFSGEHNTSDRTGKIPHVNSQYCNKDDHFVPNFPWEVLKGTAYFTKSGCLKNF